MKQLDATIDELYQAPLDQFTALKNAAAKALSGADKTRVKSLAKPPLPVWAVNQLYWKDRGAYSALVDASEKLRAAHRTLLGGRQTDIRKPEQVHRSALDRAVAKAEAILKGSDAHVSEATRESMRKTLTALPTDEQPGRMTREPEASGFSLLTGVKPRPIKERRESAATHAAATHTAAADSAPAAEPKKPRPSPTLVRNVKDAERQLQHARAAAERARFRVVAAEQKLAKLQERLANSTS